MENFLEKIQNRTLTKWKNQLIGEFKISKEHLNVFYLRFIECEIDVNNNNNFFYKHNRYDNSKMPIIAKGFVVYYISRYGKQSKEDICNDYFFSNLKNQKNEREYIQESIKQLYPFISNDDQKNIYDAIICYNKIANQPKFRINNRYFNEIDKAIKDGENQKIIDIGIQINIIINSFNFNKAIDFYINDILLNDEIEYLTKIKDYYKKCFINYNDLPEYKKILEFIDLIKNNENISNFQKNKLEFSPEQIEILKQYFIASFKGIKREDDYFNNLFIPQLKKYINSKSKKELARIASIIYDCKYFNKYHKNIAFEKFLTEFYDIMGIKTKTPYKQNQLKRDKNLYEEMKNDFNFLLL